uniref:Uncharacterized protein n=1 Tax=Rhizophora mucronata TaxID=61149 RepID=A0A2P2ND70_RHIMU
MDPERKHKLNIYGYLIFSELQAICEVGKILNSKLEKKI